MHDISRYKAVPMAGATAGERHPNPYRVKVIDLSTARAASLANSLLLTFLQGVGALLQAGHGMFCHLIMR